MDLQKPSDRWYGTKNGASAIEVHQYKAHHPEIAHTRLDGVHGVSK